MLYEELKSINSSKGELKKFGYVIAVACCIPGSYFLWRENGIYVYFFIAAAALIGSAVLYPKLLLPLHKVWMGIAMIIGMIMSFIILILLFHLVITPIGLISRLMGKDFLDMKINKDTSSYWNKRKNTKDNKISVENQY